VKNLEQLKVEKKRQTTDYKVTLQNTKQ
jgi:hypothetical protein